MGNTPYKRARHHRGKRMAERYDIQQKRRPVEHQTLAIHGRGCGEGCTDNFTCNDCGNLFGLCCLVVDIDRPLLFVCGCDQEGTQANG